MNKSLSVLILAFLWGAGILAACTGGGDEPAAAVDPAAAERYVASLATESAKPEAQVVPDQGDSEAGKIKLSKETVQRIDRSEPMIGAVLTVAR